MQSAVSRQKARSTQNSSRSGRDGSSPPLCLAALHALCSRQRLRPRIGSDISFFFEERVAKMATHSRAQKPDQPAAACLPAESGEIQSETRNFFFFRLSCRGFSLPHRSADGPTFNFFSSSMCLDAAFFSPAREKQGERASEFLSKA